MIYKIAQEIRKEIAEAIVTESEPGYSREYMGKYFVVADEGSAMLDRVVFRGGNALWNPWADMAVYTNRRLFLFLAQ